MLFETSYFILSIYILYYCESCFETIKPGEDIIHCISSINVSDYTEDFEDTSSLAKWSSLDLLAEGEDTTVRTPPAANEQG